MPELPSQSLEEPAHQLIDAIGRLAGGLAQLPRGAANDRAFAQQALKAGAQPKDVSLAISKGATAQSLGEKGSQYTSLIIESASRKNQVEAKGLSTPTPSKQVSMEI